MDGVPAPTRGPRFVGSYLFQMDEKGRVALPAAFRRGAAGSNGAPAGGAAGETLDGGGVQG